MAAGDLTTLSNAYAWLGAAPGSNDALIGRLITAVSTQIQRLISYNIASEIYDRKFNGRGGKFMSLPDVPVTAVDSVSIDGISVPAGMINGSQQAGFYFDDHSVGLVGYCFTRGYQNVEIVYTAGYETVPFDIEQACLDWIKAAWTMFDNGVGPGVAMVRAGDTAIQFAGASLVTTTGAVPIPPSVRAVTSLYQRVTPI